MTATAIKRDNDTIDMFGPQLGIMKRLTPGQKEQLKYKAAMESRYQRDLFSNTITNQEDQA